MDHYIVVKRVTLQAGEREFRKDQIITADDSGNENIERYLRKGYIRPLGDNPAEKLPAGSGPAANEKTLPFYMLAEDYLTPEQVNKLLKKPLVEYAEHIGCMGFKPNIGLAELRALVNKFIEEAVEDEADEDDEEDSEDGGEENDVPSNDTPPGGTEN